MYEQNRLVLCRMGYHLPQDYEVVQKKYNEKRCIAVFSLAYSFNAAGQGNQWSFKATDCKAYYSRRVRSYAHVLCAI